MHLLPGHSPVPVGNHLQKINLALQLRGDALVVLAVIIIAKHGLFAQRQDHILQVSEKLVKRKNFINFFLVYLTVLPVSKMPRIAL